MKYTCFNCEDRLLAIYSTLAAQVRIKTQEIELNSKLDVDIASPLLDIVKCRVILN